VPRPVAPKMIGVSVVAAAAPVGGHTSMSYPKVKVDLLHHRLMMVTVVLSILTTSTDDD